MHNNWGYGMHDNGGWWWLAMALMMVVFWGGIIAVGVALIRRWNHPAQPTTPTASSQPPAVNTARPSPREILDERFARGEIETDDYRQRVETLTGTSSR